MKNFLLRPIPDMSEAYHGTRVERELPDMLTYLKLWSYNTTRLWVIHITLGVLATFFSLLAGALMGDPYIGWARAFAFIAAVSISMLTAFNLGTKSNNVRNAWRMLNSAIIKFNHNIIPKKEVIATYEAGEALIGGVAYTSSGIIYEELAPKIQEQKQKNEKTAEKESDLQQNQNNDEITKA